MDKLSIARKAISIVAGIGGGSIASQIIANNSAPKTKVQLVTMVVGGIVLSSAVGKVASQQAESQFDEIVEAWKKFTQPKTEEIPQEETPTTREDVG
jgi:hypothetical protein